MTTTPDRSHLTLNQRANYIRQRLEPWLQTARANEAGTLLAMVDRALEERNPITIAIVEDTAEKHFAYKTPSPLTLRVGPIQHELDARSDGTPAGYRRVIMRDLARWYRYIRGYLKSHPIEPMYARKAYEFYVSDIPSQGPEFALNFLYDHYPGTDAFSDTIYTDALERAQLLVEHDDYTVDEALREVGLVTPESQP